MIQKSKMKTRNIHIRYVSLLLVPFDNFRKPKSKLLTCKFVIIVIWVYLILFIFFSKSFINNWRASFCFTPKVSNDKAIHCSWALYSALPKITLPKTPLHNCHEGYAGVGCTCTCTHTHSFNGSGAARLCSVLWNTVWAKLSAFIKHVFCVHL